MGEEGRRPSILVSSRAVLSRVVCPTMVTLGLLAAAGSPAEAAKLFVGGTIGQAQVEARFTDADFGNLGLDGSSSDSAFAYRLFAGLRLGGLGVEAGYRDFGRVSDSSEQVSVAIDTTGNLSTEMGDSPLFFRRPTRNLIR